MSLFTKNILVRINIRFKNWSVYLKYHIFYLFRFHCDPKYELILFSSLIVLSDVYSQQSSPQVSEQLIKYNRYTHTTDKPIPFDKAFTLLVEKFDKKGLLEVLIYETKSKKGIKDKVSIKMVDCCSEQVIQASIPDFKLNFELFGDSLFLYFPALKPNKEFDIVIRYRLGSNSIKILTESMVWTYENNFTKAKEVYGEFIRSVYNPINNIISVSYNYDDFRSQIFEPLIRRYYDIGTSGVSQYPSIKLNEFIALTKELNYFDYNFEYLENWINVFKDSLENELLLGRINISKPYFRDILLLTDFTNRLQNLKTNSQNLDSILIRINSLQLLGHKSVSIENYTWGLNDIRDKFEEYKSIIDLKIAELTRVLSNVEREITTNTALQEQTELVGSTHFSDLKTAGGNIMFFDAGFTNLFVRGINGRNNNFPKLYLGFSIYFRPIDRNTRRSKFVNTYSLKKVVSCFYDSIQNKVIYGPDYGVIAKRSFLQHFCLNVGLTLGSFNNSEFDNFYNNYSLIIGPAYRFRRAFKFSTGLSFVRRDSKNPAKSEKIVVPGFYTSLSVDIDFIQAIKDVTKLVF